VSLVTNPTAATAETGVCKRVGCGVSAFFRPIGNARALMKFVLTSVHPEVVE
jgi:hypothetical protein